MNASSSDIVVDSDAVELDNGENLRALRAGDSVYLDTATGHAGLWTVAGFIGEHAEKTRLTPGIDVDCANHPQVTCKYAGHRHAHPVDSGGAPLARPA